MAVPEAGHEVETAGQDEASPLVLGQSEELVADPEETVEVGRQVPADLHQEVQHVIALDAGRQSFQPGEEAADLLHRPELGERFETPLS